MLGSGYVEFFARPLQAVKHLREHGLVRVPQIFQQVRELGVAIQMAPGVARWHTSDVTFNAFIRGFPSGA